jgi:hypothetical protein
MQNDLFFFVNNIIGFSWAQSFHIYTNGSGKMHNSMEIREMEKTKLHTVINGA